MDSQSEPPVPARIVCAAMLMEDGLIVPGARHFSPDMHRLLRRIYGRGIKVFGLWLRRPYKLKVVEQGFMDARGQFHSRESAWRIAEQLGQIREQVSKPGELYSENLY